VESRRRRRREGYPPRSPTSGSSGPLLTPRNGQYEFTVTTVAPTVPNFPTCPNPQWIAHVVDVTFGDATLLLFEDGVLSDQVTVPVT
jgi:hypothetical protein